MNVSRRGLLTGAAGLVVGGAAGAGTVLATEDEPVDPSRLPSANEELMTEHGVLKRVLLCYRAVLDRIDAGARVPAGVVHDCALIVVQYIENFHEGLEEAYVFPRVRDEHDALVRTLLEQHHRGRLISARLLALPPELGTARAQVRKDVGAFVRMYEPHEAFEDTVIYPALRAAVRPATLTALAERFHDLADREFGDAALKQVLERVSGLEEQLGIGDLDAFTP